ncbi:MAG: ABC transporter ATP-binding protein [Ruminococcaceae bacterium]|nr:ABC transporter ATP-binding protein [Oscillospiraceae bacterium]
MIRICNLTKKFDDFVALDGLNMHVKKGSVYGLVGPNGSGKTTTIKHIAGVMMQNDGDVFITDSKVFENVAIKRKVIYIPDDVFFFPSYTIKDMKKFYKSVYPSWNEERFCRLADVFKIDINRRVQKLSKGMQKQVAFWLGISTMPDVMILDEPVDGLDPVMRRKVWSLILQDVAERETTVLISSHNLRELEDVCDHVGIMHNGRVVLEKQLDDIKSDVHKLQLAFKEKPGTELAEQLSPMHISEYGSVTLMIVRGQREQILECVNKYSPIVCDILPLTLEEIFIYELGGLGYEIKDVIL